MYQGQQGQAPIFILKEGTQRTRGRTAQSNNIAAAKAVADAVRSTLGPKGMDKMLVDSIGDVVITNDGATILKEMDIDTPRPRVSGVGGTALWGVCAPAPRVRAPRSRPACRARRAASVQPSQKSWSFWRPTQAADQSRCRTRRAWRTRPHSGRKT